MSNHKIEAISITWFRVDAQYTEWETDKWILVGECNDRIGYLALADRAWKDGATRIRIYKCESI